MTKIKEIKGEPGEPIDDQPEDGEIEETRNVRRTRLKRVKEKSVNENEHLINALSLAGLAGAVGIHAMGHLAGDYASETVKKTSKKAKGFFNKAKRRKTIHNLGVSAVKKELEKKIPAPVNDNDPMTIANDNDPGPSKRPANDNKLTKEAEESIEELSKHTVSIYDKIARVVKDHHGEYENCEEKKMLLRKTKNREKGITMAAKRLTKEDVDELFISAAVQEPEKFITAFEKSIKKILADKLDEMHMRIAESILK